MKNEPVAWIGKDELQFGFTDTRVTNEKESWDDIPLYTHPVKELTDEEIQLLINDVPDYDIDTYDLLNFARAILKKVSEK